ncbi:MAG TPA: hypothetical protein VIK16_07720 [Candidatus Limnocylindrales bacterium]|jgi:hypothetical protein
MPAIRLPAWLRRGLEAGLFAGLLSLLTVVAYHWDRGAAVGVAALPAGPTGTIVLALPVLAVGVFAIAYPIGLTATRLDAILGAATGAIVAADLLTLITVLTGERVAILGGANVLPVGFLAAILATPGAVGGIAASQLFSPHGFGRRAGRIGAVVAVAVATPILLIGVPLLA